MGLGSSITAHVARRLSSSTALLPYQVKVAAPSKREIDHEAYAKFYRQAAAMLMNSPRATPPRPSTIRRMMRLLVAKGPITQGARIQRGGAWVHPTKSRAAWS